LAIWRSDFLPFVELNAQNCGCLHRQIYCVTDLLLLPGLLCDERLWAAQVNALTGSVRSRVPDLSGHESISAMADAVLATSPLRFALAGFSMGGCVALEIFARAPERVCRLALLSTSAKGLTEPVREHLQGSISEIEAGGFDRYLADAFPRYVAPGRAHDRALWNAFEAMANALGSVVAVRQMRALLNYPGFASNLGWITCPTAIICGRQDLRVPVPIHVEMASQIPAAKLLVIDRCGHFVSLEQPQAVIDGLSEWLRLPVE